MTWLRFKEEEPTLPFPILVTDGRDVVIEYGPCTAKHVINCSGFFPTHWIYVRDVDMPVSV